MRDPVTVDSKVISKADPVAGCSSYTSLGLPGDDVRSAAPPELSAPTPAPVPAPIENSRKPTTSTSSLHLPRSTSMRTPSLTVMVELASVLEDAEVAAKFAEIKSQYPLNKWTLRFTDSVTEKEFWMMYSKTAVRHNFFLALLCAIAFLSRYTSSPTQFWTQLACYGTVGLTAVHEVYFFESRLRSVFVMERVLALSRGVPHAAIAEVKTLEFIEQIQVNVAAVRKRSGKEREEGAENEEIKMTGIDVRKGEKGRGVSESNHARVLRSASAGAHSDSGSDVGKSKEVETGIRGSRSSNSRQQRFRKWMTKFRRKYLYLAWEDSDLCVILP
ncbi:hypothetical protein HK104_009950 [Borealophlyctis nickersoniae]|nr:hypothetical protein HK104_009950 [Borealophlyctis nickersoniae]